MPEEQTTQCAIEGVLVQPIQRHTDHRGWLCELFRKDQLPPELLPAMAYVSVTLPGEARGPHEHREQTDFFCFPGPGTFKLFLWDNRPHSPTFGAHVSLRVGQENPCAVVIPPGVVHGYRNVGTEPAFVFNSPNRLYRGEGKRGEVDEIRYEGDPSSPFSLA